MAAKYVLRELAGVSELEAMLDSIQAHPNPLWAPENDRVPAFAGKLIEDHFGVDATDWEFEQASGPLWRGGPVWLRSIWMGEEGEEQGEASQWLDVGWDITRPDGEIMLSMAFFDGVIISAMQGLAGRLPDAAPSDEEISRRAGDFEAKLRADAEQFRKGRR